MTAANRRPLVAGLALLLLTTACSGNPADAARGYAESAERFAREGRDAAALIQYRNAVRLQPSSIDLYRRMAAVLDRLGRKDEARQTAERAESMADGSLLTEAEDDLRAIIDSRPGEVAARLALASRLTERGAIDEAAQQLRAALDIEPDRELTNRGLAAIHVSRGESSDAEARLRAAAAVRPQRHRSQIALADFLIGQQRWAEAAAVLDEAGHDPGLRERVALRQAVVADATGNGLQARAQLETVVRTHPSPEAWTLYAQFAFRDGRLSQSMDAANAALTLHPDFAPARALIEAIRWNQLRPVASKR